MYKDIFTALPEVNVLWVTEDGHFHLHPDNGGKKINRKEVFSEETKPLQLKKNNK